MSGDLRVVPVSDIRVYENNPRGVSEEAVLKMMKSLEEYGYQQPVVVDENLVIVTGHTRHQAILRLGWTEVPVVVTELGEDAAREYRVVDNRVAEFSKWNDSLLQQELREVPENIAEYYFPGLDLESQLRSVELVTSEEVEEAFEKVNAPKPSRDNSVVQVLCSHCFKPIEVPTERFLKIAREHRRGAE